MYVNKFFFGEVGVDSLREVGYEIFRERDMVFGFRGFGFLG